MRRVKGAKCKKTFLKENGMNPLLLCVSACYFFHRREWNGGWSNKVMYGL